MPVHALHAALKNDPGNAFLESTRPLILQWKSRGGSKNGDSTNDWMVMLLIDIFVGLLRDDLIFFMGGSVG